MGLRTLIEEARGVAGLDEGIFGDTLGRAQRFFQQASQRGDRDAMKYWAGVAQAAKSKAGAAKDAAPGIFGKLKDKASALSAKATQAIKDLPGNAKRLVQDAEYRKEVGTKLGAALKRKGKAALEHVKAEGHEFKIAGKALVKAAKKEKLDHHDKEALKGASKAIAMTVIGTLAMGGMGHFTIGALAKHFAAETALKAVGKAALFASVHLHEGDEATMQKWMEAVVDGIADGFSKLGSMDPEELAKILAAAKDDAGDDE